MAVTYGLGSQASKDTGPCHTLQIELERNRERDPQQKQMRASEFARHVCKSERSLLAFVWFGIFLNFTCNATNPDSPESPAKPGLKL